MKTVEVFKTSVNDTHEAGLIVQEIQRSFSGCRANFDLEDCDHVLRVLCTEDIIESSDVITLVNKYGFSAAELDDKIPA
jgi:hypothetical protein